MYVRDDLRPLHRRLAVVLGLVVLAFTALLVRLWQLQVVQAEHWRTLAESNRLRRVPLEPPRGQVVDRAGRVILSNRPTFQLLLFPEEGGDPDRTVAFLAGLGVADRGEIATRFARAATTPHLPSVIADNLSWKQMSAIAARRADYPELEVQPSTRRAVPPGPAVAHLAGQLGEVSREQLEADSSLTPGQLIGRSGLERAYEAALGGRPGSRLVTVDAVGRQVATVREDPPRAGSLLPTTIDLEVQLAAAAAMADEVGAVVAIDPRDGAVRALVSAPTFDPELFAGHLEPARWKELLADPLKPLNNRVLQALYPPGSTIKPLFASGALNDGLRTATSSVYCSGAVTLFGHPYRCWRGGGHGRVALEAAIEESCDTYFYRLAAEAGLERLASWAALFGLGTATGVELAGESSGLVPSDEWSRRVRGHEWFPGETVSVGIGQGPILVTPLQLAVAYAALVNGGMLVRPHLVEEAMRPPRPLPIAREALAVVRRGMERVVAGARGTARAQAHARVPFAGKTGTSQVVAKKEGVRWQELPWEQRHHALFVGYAPIADPQIVVVVVVEHGGDAAAVAAPIAAHLIAVALGGEDTKPVSTTPAPGQAGAG